MRLFKFPQQSLRLHVRACLVQRIDDHEYKSGEDIQQGHVERDKMLRKDGDRFPTIEQVEVQAEEEQAGRSDQQHHADLKEQAGYFSDQREIEAQRHGETMRDETDEHNQQRLDGKVKKSKPLGRRAREAAHSIQADVQQHEEGEQDERMRGDLFAHSSSPQDSPQVDKAYPQEQDPPKRTDLSHVFSYILHRVHSRYRLHGMYPPLFLVIPLPGGGRNCALLVPSKKYSTPCGGAKASKRTVSERTSREVPNVRRQADPVCITLELVICEESQTHV